MLLPNNILRQDSVLGRMVEDIPEEDWRDAVQIIGWLYQYYISEKHEEVIDPLHGKTIRKEDIPAATQIFTTDWVVRYMVDNSLGRYWIERHPESKLAEKLDFFVMPKNGKVKHIDDFIKPEEIRFLDPCMGSGHILVYAFDVLIEIYKESGYTERDAAAMIVQNNLFGLDIDERAVQLAYFAVMMKARSIDRRFLSRGVEPNVFAIYESNGIHDIVRENLTQDTQMNEISKYLTETFLNAKELGSIITADPKDYTGYIEYLDNLEFEGQFDTDDSVWIEKTRPLLKSLAQQANVLSLKYEAVCTNPPYLNRFGGELKKSLVTDYKDYSSDLFSVFIYRNLKFCKSCGYSGYMTPNVMMFIKSYEKLREYIINNDQIVTLIQMAKGAFFKEATVDVCSFVLGKDNSEKVGLYIRLEDFKGDMDFQERKVRDALLDEKCEYFYETEQEEFPKIPGCPLAYWVSEAFLNVFTSKCTIGTEADPKKGLTTADDLTFLRYWYEADYTNICFNAPDRKAAYKSDKTWFPLNKGGEYRRWYGNNEFVINWQYDGEKLRSFHKAAIRNDNYYFMESISWNDITSGLVSFRFKPQGQLFNDAGPSIFAPRDILSYLLAFGNSNIMQEICQFIAPTIHYTVGQISNAPVLYPFQKDLIDNIINLSNQNIILSKNDWDSYETSWDFKRNPLI